MMRSGRWVAAALAAAAGCAVVQVPGPAAGAGPERALEIYFVDVEGGAATLMVTPAGESVLVDCGWPGRGGRDAKRIEHAARYVAGLSGIDHFVATHWHTDHYGGIEELARLMPVRRFWDRGIPESLPEDPRGFPILMAAYRAAGGERSTTLRAGDRIPLRPAGIPMELKVVAASGKVAGEGKQELPVACERHPAKAPDPSDNGQSIALRLRYGRFDFLNCGDLTWNVEHRLVCPKNRAGKIDLWQVTHHGADSSSNPAVLEAIEPRCAVICNGPRKGGSPATFAALKKTPSLEAIYQLHRNVATTDADNTAPEYIANLEEKCRGEFIRARVSPSGEEYAVSIGASGPERRFRSR